ncbi:MAG TPA: methionine synthase [Firmicutes bacterium]|jgi:hypothetical protein|nr:methionine synthase [Bacillota bacterium]
MTHTLIQCFYNIPLDPEIESVLIRLGSRKNAPIDADFFRMLEEGMKQAKILSHPTGLYLPLKIFQRTADTVVLENETYFQSTSLSRLLQNSEETVLMAATIGPEIVDAIMNEVTQKDAALGVILDAVASQTTDAVLDWMMDYLNILLAKKGRKLTRHRYSPGYGDLSLVYQKSIFETLKLNKLGLKLTDKYMLVPEKSVIAIAGIEPKEY